MVETKGDNPTPNPDQGNVEVEKPEYLTKDEFGKSLNAAITSRMKSFEKQFEAINGVLARLAPPPPEEKPERPNTAELAEMKKRMDALQKERDEERQLRRGENLRKQIQEKLTAKGIKPEFIGAVMAKLVDADKSVGYDEADQIIFRSQDGEYDLETGISNWIKNEGKVFLAPKGVAGAGFRSMGGKTTAPVSQREQDEELVRKLKGLLG